jgi:hypothetical protein
MRQLIIAIVLSLLSFAGFAQETNVYTFFLNVVNDDFKFPLIGFVNMANGNHKGVQLGFVNWNVRNFTGLQMGMVNTLGADLTGAQLAYINTTIQQVHGVQIGFINTAIQQVNGAQISFINTALHDVHGAQVGYINTAKQEFRGVQSGFVNTALQKVDGAQIGFVNTATKESYGPQIGFVNAANRKESGFQLGFINFADTIAKGVPIGFLSIVRRGGYFAFEVAFSEFFPVTVGFKTGIEKFYTTVFLAYQPAGKSSKDVYASGFGFGTIIPLRKSFFFNPEIHSFSTIEKKNNRQLTSIVPLFGYHLSRNLSITAGPTVTWSNSEGDGVILKPVFNIASFGIDKNNSIFVGARTGVRVRF